jgi:hypothetical protein
MSVQKKIAWVFLTLALVFTQAAALVQPALAASGTVRVYADSVQEDKYVTLVGAHLQANSRYTIYLSKAKTYNDKAVLVGTATTDSAGSFTKTYRIPGKLVDVVRINIYINNGRNDTVSNWFINATAVGNTGGESAAAFSFSVVSVKEGDTVRIKTNNLPANVTFKVYIGREGSKGINGILVGTLKDSKGGSVRSTFDIPDTLAKRSKLDIRIESKNLGIVQYLTFNNE